MLAYLVEILRHYPGQLAKSTIDSAVRAEGNEMSSHGALAMSTIDSGLRIIKCKEYEYDKNTCAAVSSYFGPVSHFSLPVPAISDPSARLSHNRRALPNHTCDVTPQ